MAFLAHDADDWAPGASLRFAVPEPAPRWEQVAALAEEGMGAGEIAAVLGLSRGTVYQALHTARSQEARDRTAGAWARVERMAKVYAPDERRDWIRQQMEAWVEARGT